MTSTLRLGDCLEVLRTMPDNSVDAVVTDPPYGLSFMGKRWDYDVPSVAIWAECLRVLKPGGHLLAFAGTRTQHRMAVRIEDAGFEIRDMIAWVYGSGFPKSLDVSKAIDKAAGAEREVVGSYTVGGTAAKGKHKGRAAAASDEGAAIGCTKDLAITAPATPEAQQWAGWGTALKPALEPITMARKPLAGTVAANVLEHGTGALNVDGCRIGDPIAYASGGFPERTNRPEREGREEAGDRAWARSGEGVEHREVSGRWPANLIHDGSEEVVGLFPQTASGGFSQGMVQHSRTFNVAKSVEAERVRDARAPDSGSAARFFYTAKASRDDRDPGNTHPTVKPTDLMRYLCRLVTPPGGIVLDPFMGSGSTGKAAMLEGFGFIGIEREAPSYAIAQQRISRAQAAGHQPDLFASAGPVA
jgi:site-specific DNA-methyltransferase (adenine-specific)